MSSGLQDLKRAPRFIAVEGPIGVGKTSLTKRLAETFNYELLLENAEENPFLDRFYQNPRQHALATQLFSYSSELKKSQNRDKVIYLNLSVSQTSLLTRTGCLQN